MHFTCTESRPPPSISYRVVGMERRYVIEPKNTIEVLNRFEFRHLKKYGQNFLIDAHVLDKVMAAAAVGKDDCVLEIGPGVGTMTQYLCEAAGKVVAIEIDRKLIPILEYTLAGYDNVEVVRGDVLACDLRAMVDECNGGRPVKVVANLPYYITTPILMGLFEQGLPLVNVTVMVQKEVANRMAAKPGTKDYGALTLAVAYYAEPYLVANVPPNCFLPRPGVGSAVVRLNRHKEPPVKVDDEGFLFRLIRASFNQRRKTLVNGLRNDEGVGLGKEAVEGALGEMGLPSDVRGEKLSLNQFAILSNLLYNRTK